jgi:hypothetical protein
MWNAIVQGMNSSEEHILRSKDSLSEVDYINGHLKKMLSDTLLNGFRKNGVPNHELTLKVGYVCLTGHSCHTGLGLANNSRIRIIAIHRYCVEVVTIGKCRELNVRIQDTTDFVQIQITVWKVISAKKIAIPIASGVCHDIQQESISDTLQSAS